MKRGYKKLLIFELVIFAILILNSFVWNILSSFRISMFLLIALMAFKYIFGFEKDKRRYTKDLIMEVIIFLAIFFILYYLFGVLISFYKTGNHYTIIGLRDFILPTALYIFLKEYFRYMVICKSEGSKLLFITAIIMFVSLDITTALYFRNFNTSYSTFLFVALTLLPAISSNTILCYFTNKTGYKPLIIYSCILSLYTYLVPIAPNPNQYILSIIRFLLPIILGYRFYKFLQKDYDREVRRDYRKKHIAPIAIATFIVVTIYNSTKEPDDNLKVGVVYEK